jgi:type II secretory pathway component PulL
MKDKIIKKYYKLLIGLLGGYFILTLFLAYKKIWAFEKHIFIYLAISFMYYMIVKNILAKRTYKLLAEIDVNIKNEIEEREKLRKEKINLLTGKKYKSEKVKRKWYYNNLIMVPIYLLVILALFYFLYKRG